MFTLYSKLKGQCILLMVIPYALAVDWKKDRELDCLTVMASVN